LEKNEGYDLGGLEKVRGIFILRLLVFSSKCSPWQNAILWGIVLSLRIALRENKSLKERYIREGIITKVFLSNMENLMASQ
jgi:hypothetical protein